ncbi:MAG: hypothetical protein ABIR30_05835 [Chitinophagaceae bacterium]
MKKITGILPILLLCSQLVAGQLIDSVKFFTDEQLIEMTITTDIKALQSEKKMDVFQDADVTMRFTDSTVINGKVSVGARGHFRREFCTIPPLMLNFRGPAASRLSSLGKLKLVIGCGTKSDDEQLILKEYLVYKMYNILEKKSFRARLLRVTYNDSRSKVKSYTQYAFLLEDDADMARRNGCVKKDKLQFLTESTNRDLMTMVAVFEYMISNGDWSVPNNHNTKLIFEKNIPAALPYVVPYDFDHSGFVNAGYALPNELLGTESVTERVYRGFPRTMEELESVFEEFRKHKEKIYSLIMNFSLLKERTRKEAVDYLEDFYKTINNKSQVKTIFIDNARTK